MKSTQDSRKTTPPGKNRDETSKENMIKQIQKSKPPKLKDTSTPKSILEHSDEIRETPEDTDTRSTESPISHIAIEVDINEEQILITPSTSEETPAVESMDTQMDSDNEATQESSVQTQQESGDAATYTEPRTEPQSIPNPFQVEKERGDTAQAPPINPVDDVPPGVTHSGHAAYTGRTVPQMPFPFHVEEDTEAPSINPVDDVPPGVTDSGHAAHTGRTVPQMPYPFQVEEDREGVPHAVRPRDAKSRQFVDKGVLHQIAFAGNQLARRGRHQKSRRRTAGSGDGLHGGVKKATRNDIPNQTKFDVANYDDVRMRTLQRYDIDGMVGQPPGQVVEGLLPMPKLPSANAKTPEEIQETRKKNKQKDREHAFELFYCLHEQTKSDRTENNAPFFATLPTLSKALQQDIPAMQKPSQPCFMVPQEGSKMKELQYGSSDTEKFLYENITKSVSFEILKETLSMLNEGVVWSHDSKFIYLKEACYDRLPNTLREKVQRLTDDEYSQKFYNSECLTFCREMQSAMEKEFSDIAARTAFHSLFKILCRVFENGYSRYAGSKRYLHKYRSNLNKLLQRIDDLKQEIARIDEEFIKLNEANLNEDEKKGKIDDIRKLRNSRTGTLESVNHEVLLVRKQIDDCKKGYKIDFDNLPFDTSVDLISKQIYETPFAYCTSDIPFREFTRTKTDAYPAPGFRYSSRQRKRMEYIGRLINRRPVWNWCNRTYKCRPPTSTYQCDISILMRTPATSEYGSHFIPLVHNEVDAGRTTNNDRFAKMCAEVVQALSYQPVAYGMITRHQDLSLYQFTRVPSTSSIKITEKNFIFNGMSHDGTNQIGQQLEDICREILRAMTHCVFNLTNTWRPIVEHLESKQFQVVNVRQNTQKIPTCLYCWRIPSTRWLDWMIKNQPLDDKEEDNKDDDEDDDMPELEGDADSEFDDEYYDIEGDEDVVFNDSRTDEDDDARLLQLSLEKKDMSPSGTWRLTGYNITVPLPPPSEVVENNPQLQKNTSVVSGE